MTEEDIAARRRKLRFRAWHRGTRESDLLLGHFADRYISEFDGAQLDRFEALLGENDPDIYDWITGRQSLPPDHDNEIARLLCTFSFKTEPL